MDRRQTGTRQRILDEALRLFAERGSAGTSMRAIADAVGIRGASLYAHFDGKQDILDELVTRAGPMGVLEVLPASTDDDAAAYLTELVEQVIRRWSAPQARRAYALLVIESLRGALPDDRSLQSMIAPVLNAVGARLSEFVAAGSLRGDHASDILAWELLAPLANLRMSHWHPRASRRQVARGRAIAREHLAYFLARNVLAHPDA